MILAVWPAHAASIPVCAGPTEIARARIVRVEQNGALILSDGRALLLEAARARRHGCQILGMAPLAARLAGGTLLLDEVSEIPPNLQAKLLPVLQEREFERVGGSKPIKVNVRILATSNRDLLRCVEQGSFRADLYYRLNVFPIHVPPLRERGEEIPILAESFLRLSARRSGIRILGFSPQAMHALRSYRWPGNVRELQNTIERAVILSENDRPISGAALGIELPAGAVGDVVESDWQPPASPVTGPAAEPLTPRVAPAAPPPPAASPVSEPALRSLAEMEKQAILAAMKAKDGNRAQVVELLGISIRTLRNKLQEYRESGDFSDE